jgi:cell division protein FtsB
VERVRAKTPKLISARAMVLGIVALLAFVLVYPTLHSYLAEKTAVDALRAQVAAAQQENDDLNADLSRWDDPAYITAQARERLSFVMPGETAWRVVDPETVPGEAPAPVVTPAAPTTPDVPWYGKVWLSVQGADKASDEPTAQPSDDPTGSSSPAATP